jgi:acyl-CoA reductase-like NAD-dependent aldehyde dehydrogenase
MEIEMALKFKQYIDGAWSDASHGKTWDVMNPATEKVIKTVPFGTGEDCETAIEAAAKAFPKWSAKTPYERAAILKKTADSIRERVDALFPISVRESDKPMAEARAEWLVAADLFEWFAEEGKRAYGRTIPSRKADKRMMVLQQPIGVAGVITAWNFPAYNPVRAWAAALAAGCTVVGRPSEYTPMTAMAIMNLLAEAGIPAGVMNLINGEPAPMGQAMLAHPACRKIHFTGSVRVGRILMDGASKTFTRLSLELGGNAPVLIFPDADIEALAQTAARTKYRNNGQVCISPQRFLVNRRVEDEFIHRVVEETEKLKVGDGFDPQTNVGPLINATQRDRVVELVENAPNEKADIVTGGFKPAHLTAGYFYQPTVLKNVSRQTRLFNEEIFGPVMPITAFGDLEEAVGLANATPYGLAAYVWTNDLKTAIHTYEKLEFGMIGVNEWLPHSTEAPFGGWKQSGIGHESGQEGLAEYLEKKLVSIGK